MPPPNIPPPIQQVPPQQNNVGASNGMAGYPKIYSGVSRASIDLLKVFVMAMFF
jgi:hypothetical protein